LPEADQQKIRESFQRFGGGGRPAPAAGMMVGREPSSALVLATGQLWNPAEKIKFPTLRAQGARPGIVWVLNAEKKPEPRRVMLGITDGANTEIVSGDIKESDKVIIGDLSQGASQSNQPGGQSRSPFGGPFGGGPRR